MKYSELRPTIKSGDVIAWSEGGWTSLHDIQVSLVRMFTRSEYSHIGICYVIGGRVMVVEAVVPLVRIFPLSKLLPFYYIRTPNSWWSEKAEELLLSRVGEKYSKWEAIRSFFTKDTNNEQVWECSKLVNRTLMEFDSGFDNLNDTPTASIKYLMDEHNLSLVYVE